MKAPGESVKGNDNVQRPAQKTRARGWRAFGIVILALAILLGIGRVILPSALRHYVNRTLDRAELYRGKIGDLQVHLLRGAYSIDDVTISKVTGDVPVPLLVAKRIDFSLEWRALLHRRVVGKFTMIEPELNFVDAPTESESQSGEGPWLAIIRDLFPFTINSAIIKEGSVHFRAYQTPKPVDVYLSHVNAIIDDLGNIRRETNPLVTRVDAAALVMDQAKLELKMVLDPFSYRPTFHLGVRMLGLDATRLNDLALAYGKFDFKRGWFDLVVETDSKEGQITGYVKPLFRDLKVFSLAQDMREDSALQFFWQALLGGATTLLKNRTSNQFGTLVPFSGDVSTATTTDILATIGNVLRNAFVRAYLPRLENGQSVAGGGIEFGAPDFAEAISASDESQ